MKSPLLNKHGKPSRLPLLLSFFLPLLIACIVFAAMGIYPFGDAQILAHDEWHQYYPFFSAFREKLVSGGSLQYTWDIGMGTGYASLFAYYLASPLNLLAVLTPASLLRELFALLTVLKIALAGLFFAVFLRTVYRKNDLSLPFFALLYALCSWVGGYYWNNMWLDTFALLPLLVAGTVCLLREGRFRLYICALALSLWCNYYIAYFCCIFILMSFIIFCICCWQGWKSFLRRFLRIGVCTLVGAAIAAVLLLPTIKAMESTYSFTAKDFELLSLNIAEEGSGVIPAGESTLHYLFKTTLPNILSASRKVLTNLLPAPEITKMSGLPNIACGFSAVILAIWFCCCPKLRIREKILNVLLLCFLLLGFISRALDYAWHGFHFTNMLPYRFSFLFSFVLLGMAFRAFTLLDRFKRWHLFIVMPLAALLLISGWSSKDTDRLSLIAGAMVFGGMLAFFLIYSNKNTVRRMIAYCLLFAIITCEAVLCLQQGASTVGTTTRSIYPKDGKSVQALLKEAEQDNQGQALIYRTETTSTQTLNDGALNHYKGLSIFTSSANVNYTRFSRSLGLSSWPGSNRTLYYESSPLTNTLCALKYLLDRDGQYRDTSYNSLVSSAGSTNLLRCNTFISLGFMTDSRLAEFVAEDQKYNPIWEQNDLFRLATGIEEPLYTKLTHSELIPSDKNSTLTASGTSGTQYSYDCSKATGRSSFSVLYIAPSNGVYCATTKFSGVSDVSVYHNGEYLFQRNIKARSLFSIGDCAAGDEIKLVYFVDEGKSGTFSADVELLNGDVFQRGWQSWADEPWKLTEVSDTRLCGTVKAKQDGLFYAAIPYEPGWTATVDGKAVTLASGYDPQNPSVALTDGMISFPLSAGTHTIELRYRTPGLWQGAFVSFVGLLAFAAMLYFLRKEWLFLPDPEKRRAIVPETKEADAEADVSDTAEP